MSSGNFYEVLGIDGDASPEDVRRAYRKRALQTHPDRLPQGATEEDKAAAGEQFRKVNNAYEILIDSKNRNLYDLYGVWPPPEGLSGQSKPQRRDRPNHPPPHYPPGPFDDPFFHTPLFGDPFSHHRLPPTFMFRDPFELFDSIFADMHRDFHHAAPPFGSPFMDPFPFSSRPSHMLDHRHPFPMPSISPFLLSPNLFNPVAFPGEDSSSTPHRSQTYSFQSSSRAHYPGPGGQDPRWVSESKMVRTVNGVTQTIYKKIDHNGNEHVKKVYPDGREKYTINGVEQTSSSWHIQDAPPQRQVEDVPADEAPFIPPQPETGAFKKHWWSRH